MQRETETSQLSKIQLDRSFELGTKDGIIVLVSKTSSNLLIKNDCANVNIPFYDENWNWKNAYTAEFLRREIKIQTLGEIALDNYCLWLKIEDLQKKKKNEDIVKRRKDHQIEKRYKVFYFLLIWKN
jgi:hypothetical protein